MQKKRYKCLENDISSKNRRHWSADLVNILNNTWKVKKAAKIPFSDEIIHFVGFLMVYKMYNELYIEKERLNHANA